MRIASSRGVTNLDAQVGPHLGGEVQHPGLPPAAGHEAALCEPGSPHPTAPAAVCPLFLFTARCTPCCDSAKGDFVPLCAQDLITKLTHVVGRSQAEQRG